MATRDLDLFNFSAIALEWNTVGLGCRFRNHVRGSRIASDFLREHNKMNRGSLLLVDDDRQILEGMADYLRSLGHRTETAATYEDALRRIKEFPFEVVLCDVNLPDADGFSCWNGPRRTRPKSPSF